MYLPFVGTKGRPAMGLRPLNIEDWIEIDKDFVSQLRYKAWLLAHRYEDVFVSSVESQAAQQECLDLLTEHLVQHFPDVYQIMGDRQAKGEAIAPSTITNIRTKQTWHFSDFSLVPLDLAARLVQEDLCLMLPTKAGYQLAAASVCFPLRWKLKEKLSQPISQIHHRVPGYTNKLARPVNHVFDSLRKEYPGIRFNWSIVDSPELHLTQEKHATEFDPSITIENIEEKLWLRVERQTLRRLPISRGVLFTIRTYVYPLTQVIKSPEVARQLADAVRLLHPDMQKYKNLMPFRQALLAYLDSYALSRTSV
ncbi:hypothetical protein S7335_3177 [Synechococcus sp. PCC 7335]|uniref:heme-dependent oxidative N-demethylase family protein n=1 Tax=Synechococcus sp. (strain ATCC 29403 / PCC 7335) TaxID=91464 RepID=UPI00017EB151|nr:DUF3445 domain-containing protein [Synechococcus sp. PCC 7335]EDX85476.1 hypothetical protein S7335_3177 [Synechococcus sp. PCC 7335]